MVSAHLRAIRLRGEVVLDELHGLLVREIAEARRVVVDHFDEAILHAGEILLVAVVDGPEARASSSVSRRLTATNAFLLARMVSPSISRFAFAASPARPGAAKIANTRIDANSMRMSDIVSLLLLVDLGDLRALDAGPRHQDPLVEDEGVDVARERRLRLHLRPEGPDGGGRHPGLEDHQDRQVEGGSRCHSFACCSRRSSCSRSSPRPDAPEKRRRRIERYSATPSAPTRRRWSPSTYGSRTRKPRASGPSTTATSRISPACRIASSR